MSLTLPDEPARLCLVDRIIKSLDDEDARNLKAWLADDSISAGRIAQALNNGGHPVSSSTIVAYRAGKR